MIRPSRAEETPVICVMMACMDPWLRLKITAEDLEAAISSDPYRRLLLYVNENDLPLAAITYRETAWAEHLFRRGAGPQLAALHNIPWPCEWHQMPPGGYVHSLAVFPGAEGQGLGRQLLARTEQELTQARSEMAYLMVSDSNTHARDVYLKAGYQLVGSVNDCIQPGNTEHIMCKRLG